MNSDPHQEKWIAFASPTRFLDVGILKGQVSYAQESAFIKGRCVPSDKVWDTEEGAKGEALRLIEIRMKKLLGDIEALDALAKRIAGTGQQGK